MADKPEMDLDLKSDCAWVRALDASGNSIRIAKADMVELIRKEMPIVTTNKSGLVPGGQLAPIILELEPNQTIDIPGRALAYMDFGGGGEMSLVSFGYWSHWIIHDSSLNSFISIRNKGASVFEIKNIRSSKFLFVYSLITMTN